MYVKAPRSSPSSVYSFLLVLLFLSGIFELEVVTGLRTGVDAEISLVQGRKCASSFLVAGELFDLVYTSLHLIPGELGRTEYAPIVNVFVAEPANVYIDEPGVLSNKMNLVALLSHDLEL